MTGPDDGGVLGRICDEKADEVAHARRVVPEPDTAAAPAPRTFDLGDFGVVAEVKRASPSAGAIASGADAVAQARTYAGAGVTAVSVLTDGPWFGGSLDDLRDVRAAVDVPLLRKDFVVDRYQIAEARAAGADLVLLIVAALAPAQTVEFADEIRSFGMTPLVEVHGRDEVPTALTAVAGGGVVGVNARNLRTLDVDLAVWDDVAADLPDDVVCIAESGVRTPDDAARAAAAGYRGVLCGEALMRADDPAAFVAAMLAAAASDARGA